jgi:hypothetical protein
VAVGDTLGVAVLAIGLAAWVLVPAVSGRGVLIGVSVAWLQADKTNKSVNPAIILFSILASWIKLKV